MSVQPHVQSFSQKSFACAVGQIKGTSLGRPVLHKEGRFAVVTNVGRGMRWTHSHQLTRDERADGEVVWS